jgi:hypothetical protein
MGEVLLSHAQYMTNTWAKIVPLWWSANPKIVYNGDTKWSIG